MVGVSLQSADAVVLVYAVNDEASWDEVARLRDTVIRYKGEQVGAQCGYTVNTSAANRLFGEVVQSRRRPLLGPSPG